MSCVQRHMCRLEMFVCSACARLQCLGSVCACVHLHTRRPCVRAGLQCMSTGWLHPEPCAGRSVSVCDACSGCAKRRSACTRCAVRRASVPPLQARCQCLFRCSVGARPVHCTWCRRRHGASAGACPVLMWLHGAGAGAVLVPNRCRASSHAVPVLMQCQCWCKCWSPYLCGASGVLVPGQCQVLCGASADAVPVPLQSRSSPRPAWGPGQCQACAAPVQRGFPVQCQSRAVPDLVQCRCHPGSVRCRC